MTSIKHFVVNGDEKSVQDTLSKLKFISKIKCGEKLDVESLSVQETSVILSFIRTFFRNESRSRTITFIRTTYGEAFELVESYLKQGESSFNKSIADLFLMTIADSQTGLENLTKTYVDDRMFVAKIDTILDTIKAKLKEFTK